jgi:ABC-type nickel/cobalt efflux system permease component RcnA
MRRLGAASAVLTILVGLAVLPHTHMHASAASANAHHAHHAPLVHAHVTPHDHDAEPADEGTHDEGGAQQIRSVDAFVFQTGAAPSAPIPVLIATALIHFEIPELPAPVTAAHPRAHGPPLTSTSALRAPPLAPPALF